MISVVEMKSSLPYKSKVIEHKSLSASYKKDEAVLTPIEFETIEKRINKTKARYFERYIIYKGILSRHNIICEACKKQGIKTDLNELGPLPFEEFVDCCWRGYLFECYSIDSENRQIYLDQFCFDSYKDCQGLKHELQFQFDVSDELYKLYSKSNKKSKYNISLIPEAEWFGEEKKTQEEKWQEEYPNLFKMPKIKTVDIEYLKKKYLNDNQDGERKSIP